MKMKRDETKREVQRLWKDWPDRQNYDDVGMCALAFHGWLQSSGQSIMSYGNFGSGSPYQTVAGWVKEWDRTWGEIERLEQRPREQ